MKKPDKTTLIIMALVVALVACLSYIGFVSMQNLYSSYYMRGINDGQQIIVNNLLSQLSTNGFITLTFNAVNGTQTIRLVPTQ